MSIGVDSFVSQMSTGNPTISVTVGEGSNRALFFLEYIEDGSYSTSVEFNGVPLSLVFQRKTNDNAESLAVWVLASPDSGTHNIVSSGATSGKKHAVCIGVFTGVDQSTPAEASVGAGAKTVDITTLSANAWPFCMAGITVNNATVTPGAGLTKQTEASDNWFCDAWVDFNATKDIGTYTLDYSSSATRFGIIAVSIKEFVPPVVNSNFLAFM